MATIRKWLNESEFDWKNGHIIYQQVTKDSYSPGWGDPEKGEEIESDHFILDHEFYSGYGAPQCPRFFAKDNNAIYFPFQYDGATGIEKIFLDPSYYLTKDHPTPYPGG